MIILILLHIVNSLGGSALYSKKRIWISTISCWLNYSIQLYSRHGERYASSNGKSLEAIYLNLKTTKVLLKVIWLS